MNDEVDRIQTAYEALRTLDYPAQQRALTWLRSRFADDEDRREESAHNGGSPQ